MRIRRSSSRTLALAIAAALVVTSLPVSAPSAGLVTTEQVVGETAAAGDRERLVAILMRDDVRQQMAALGVDRDEAVARLASLSDEEVQRIAGQLQALPAGEGFFEGVLITAGVIFLVLVATDLLGVTNVFGFINPIR